jgi:hypothetical protein
MINDEASTSICLKTHKHFHALLQKRKTLRHLQCEESFVGRIRTVQFPYAERSGSAVYYMNCCPLKHWGCGFDLYSAFVLSSVYVAVSLLTDPQSKESC